MLPRANELGRKPGEPLAAKDESLLVPGWLARFEILAR